MRQKSRGNEIVRDCLTLGIDIKTKEHNPHDMIEPDRQIVEGADVAILAWIERLLTTAALLDRCLQIISIVCQFRVVIGLDDMLPSLFRQINGVVLTVLNSPTSARASHAIAFQCHEMIVQRAWLFFTLISAWEKEKPFLRHPPRPHASASGCPAPHSHLRAAIIPTPRQQGVDQPEGSTTAPNWSWARLLKRVFGIDMERCPVCQQGRLRIIAAITKVSVMQKILRHLKLAVDPTPIAPAQRVAFAWDFASP